MAKIILQATAIAVVVFVLAAVSLATWRSLHPLPPPNEAHGAQKAETENKNAQIHKSFLDRTAEDPVAFFTLWLTAFTGILAAFTLWMAFSTKDLRDFAEEQARDMKESIAAAKVSADAAKTAVELSDRTAERQLRAYVGFKSGGVFSTADNTRVGAWVKIKNFGVTPAYRVKGWLKFARLPVDHYPWDETQEPASEAIIQPSGDFALTAALSNSDTQQQAVLSGAYHYFVWGKVEYRDAFDKPRFFSFRSQSGGPLETVLYDDQRVPGWGWRPTKNDGMKAN
jgi:hypothetical protein